MRKKLWAVGVIHWHCGSYRLRVRFLTLLAEVRRQREEWRVRREAGAVAMQRRVRGLQQQRWYRYTLKMCVLLQARVR
jgi:hypothetical protein